MIVPEESNNDVRKNEELKLNLKVSFVTDVKLTLPYQHSSARNEWYCDYSQDGYSGP